MLPVTQIVRFLLERGLRFRDLGSSFCGHDVLRLVLYTLWQRPSMHRYRSTPGEGLAFFPPFLASEGQ
jgi:hypothetical protein